MITDRVIKEIYKKYNKEVKNADTLNIKHYLDMLSAHHQIRLDGNEVIFENQEEFSPFRRFLIRALYGIIEFDRHVAFVFRNHILFLGKDNAEMRVHMRPLQDKRNIFQRIFAN